MVLKSNSILGWPAILWGLIEGHFYPSTRLSIPRPNWPARVIKGHPLYFHCIHAIRSILSEANIVMGDCPCVQNPADGVYRKCLIISFGECRWILLNRLASWGESVSIVSPLQFLPASLLFSSFPSAGVWTQSEPCASWPFLIEHSPASMMIIITCRRDGASPRVNSISFDTLRDRGIVQLSTKQAIPPGMRLPINLQVRVQGKTRSLEPAQPHLQG